MRKGFAVSCLVIGVAWVLGTQAWADGIASWSSEQFPSDRPIYYWQNGHLERFVYTTDKADWEYQNEGWETAKYWQMENKRARHHTVSYYVDVGDLGYRMGSKRDALTYFHLARTVKRKTVEDHLELGEAFLSVQEPGVANFYFTEAMTYARSRKDWQMISDGFAHVGNKYMAELTHKRAMDLR